jgi:hypothetical protein
MSHHELQETLLWLRSKSNPQIAKPDGTFSCSLDGWILTPRQGGEKPV